jgi:hypothetical protein
MNRGSTIQWLGWKAFIHAKSLHLRNVQSDRHPSLRMRQSSDKKEMRKYQAGCAQFGQHEVSVLTIVSGEFNDETVAEGMRLRRDVVARALG